jgi:hypothetical protein
MNLFRRFPARTQEKEQMRTRKEQMRARTAAGSKCPSTNVGNIIIICKFYFLLFAMLIIINLAWMLLLLDAP